MTMEPVLRHPTTLGDCLVVMKEQVVAVISCLQKCASLAIQIVQRSKSALDLAIGSCFTPFAVVFVGSVIQNSLVCFRLLNV